MQSTIVPGPTPINLLAISNLYNLFKMNKSQVFQHLMFCAPEDFCGFFGSLPEFFFTFLWWCWQSWYLRRLPFEATLAAGRGFSDGLVVNDPRMYPTNVFVFIYSTVMSKGGCFLQHPQNSKKVYKYDTHRYPCMVYLATLNVGIFTIHVGSAWGPPGRLEMLVDPRHGDIQHPKGETTLLLSR